MFQILVWEFKLFSYIKFDYHTLWDSGTIVRNQFFNCQFVNNIERNSAIKALAFSIMF